ERDFAELQLHAVEQQQPADQRRPGAGDEVDRFERLEAADHTGDHSHDPALGAGRDELWWRWLAVEAAIAGTAPRIEHRRLTLEAQHRAIDRGNPEQHASVVDEVARRE